MRMVLWHQLFCNKHACMETQTNTPPSRANNTQPQHTDTHRGIYTCHREIHRYWVRASAGSAPLFPLSSSCLEFQGEESHWCLLDPSGLHIHKEMEKMDTARCSTPTNLISSLSLSLSPSLHPHPSPSVSSTATSNPPRVRTQASPAGGEADRLQGSCRLPVIACQHSAPAGSNTMNVTRAMIPLCQSHMLTLLYMVMWLLARCWCRFGTILDLDNECGKKYIWQNLLKSTLQKKYENETH